jgi:hypothetical protein
MSANVKGSVLGYFYRSIVYALVWKGEGELISRGFNVLVTLKRITILGRGGYGLQVYFVVKACI